MQRCESCGSKTEGRTACQALFERLLAREFSDYRYFRVHRMNVDSYSLQHPDDYCASAKSLIAHLCGLCCAMEFPHNPELLRALRSSLDGKIEAVRPVLPEFRGDLTIEHVMRAQQPDVHIKAAAEWAWSVWQAYAPLHDFARAWLQGYGHEGMRAN